MTQSLCNTFPLKTSMETLDDGTIILGFSVDVGSSSFHSTRKDFLVSFSVYWEFPGGNGRACVFLQNLGGDETDAVFMKFYEDFETELSIKMNAVVDLTV